LQEGADRFQRVRTLDAPQHVVCVEFIAGGGLHAFAQVISRGKTVGRQFATFEKCRAKLLAGKIRVRKSGDLGRISARDRLERVGYRSPLGARLTATNIDRFVMTMDPSADRLALSWFVPLRRASRPCGRLLQTYALLRATTDQNIGQKRQIEPRNMFDMINSGGTS